MQADAHTQSQVTKQRSLITLANSLDYCTQEAVLSQRVAKCCLHNSKTQPGIGLVLRHPGGVDLNVTEYF